MSQDIFDFCKLFYSSTYIPISYCSRKGDIYVSYSPFPAEWDIYAPIIPSMLHTKKSPDILISNIQGLYGIIRLNGSDDFLLLGPVFTLPVSQDMAHAFLIEHAVAKKEDEQALYFLNTLPRITRLQFQNHLCFIHLTLNKALIDPAEHFMDENITPAEKIAASHLEQIYSSKENEDFHNTYFFEQELYHYIEEGNPEKLKALLNTYGSSTLMREGVLADTPLRQAKNVFLANVTKAGTLGGIPGGMDIEEAYHLMDVYFQECEKMQSVSEIDALNYTMLLDFCSRTAALKIPDGVSMDVFKSMNYIRNHTNEDIDIRQVAEHINRSVSYITAKFKNELGINMGAFIMRCKLEEAKSLLTYSNRSLADISSYLCFSSQSYFQNVFKKKFGVTPAEYRKRGNENMQRPDLTGCCARD